MGNPLIRKLEYGAALNGEDRDLLESICSRPTRVPARTDIAREGEKPVDVHLVLEGFACRYKTLPDGRRQIMAFFVPGDFCDLHVQILGEMDHSIATLVGSQIIRIDPATIGKLTVNPRINRALWWCTLVDEGTLREWLVNMGQRPADRQLAHLFCELLVRLKAVGRAQGDGFDMPFTQEGLAEALGITPVHANRTLMHLRSLGLIRTEGRRLILPDFDRLRDYAGFEPNYLHLHDAAGTLNEIGGPAPR